MMEMSWRMNMTDKGRRLVDNLAGIVFPSVKFMRKLRCTSAHGFARLRCALS